MSKPEPIRVGVQGFVAFEAKPEQPPEPIDWLRLCGLPPFCMFAEERSGKPPINIHDWLQSHRDDQSLYTEYCQWHEAKGYWPNETPLGEIKDQKK